MTRRTAVFTIIAKNYLPSARVLMKSLGEHHPDWRRLVVLVDEIDGYFDPRDEDFQLISSSDLSIFDLRWFQFKYSIVELSTALKPYAFDHLFKTYEFDEVIYLDPDIKVYSPLRKVAEALESANIALTPHLTTPIEDDRKPTEIDILRTGAYNLGFIGIAKSHQTAEFLSWWKTRLYDRCVIDLAGGLFVDQKWLDLAPGMFEGVEIIRDPGYNVAYWNLPHRVLSSSPAGYKVGGALLSFFHFSGFDADQPDMLSRHQNENRVQNLPDATRQLLVSYQKELWAAGYPVCRNWPYTFATFKNGVRIPDVCRPLHHEAPETVIAIRDPFSDDGFAAFLEVWNGPMRENQPGISRLAYRIYSMRTDVQAEIPDIFGGNYDRFVAWMLSSGKREHQLAEAFLAGTSKEASDIPDRRDTSVHQQNFSSGERGDEMIDEPGAASGRRCLRLTRLASAIYQSRPDLQQAFPDPGGSDALGFLLWLLTYGRKEHSLSAQHLLPMKAQWRPLIASLSTFSERLGHHLALRTPVAYRMLGTVVHRWHLLRCRLSSLRSAQPSMLVDLNSQPIDLEPDRPREFGVNVVGYFESETGVGQSARAAQESLRAVGIPISLRSPGDFSPSRKQDHTAGPMSTEFPYGTNLLHINADQTLNVRRRLGEPFYSNRHNIGYWAWELEEFPDRWGGAFGSYDEIWTPSNFCRQAIRKKTAIPVFCIPHAISPVAAQGMDRQHFGLDPDAFLFLSAFDVLSIVERKNPLAAIRAFELAFGARSPCQLIVKINNGWAAPRCIDTLRNACSCGGIRIIDSALTRTEMNALSRCVDCAVSLHRSEGFGLLIAEAMYFDKPVIVTNYSGNTDFTRPDNSMLVDYKLIPVPRHCEPYDEGLLWADPDVTQAAQHMTSIFSNVDLRTRLAKAGGEFVRTALSPQAVGGMMRERLVGLRDIESRTMATHAGARSMTI